MFGSAHWKVEAIDEYAGDRPAAWIDDNIDETRVAWAEAAAPLPRIVETSPPEGLTDEHVTRLLRWADELEGWIASAPRRGRVAGRHRGGAFCLHPPDAKR